MASVEKDGVRVTITLERDPMPAGEPTWVTTEVRNVGPDDLIWGHGGCAITVYVSGTIADVTWHRGVAQTGGAGDFKRWVLDRLVHEPAPIDFTPEPYVGRERTVCTMQLVTESIHPGDAIVQRARWDGMAAAALGPAPAGVVELVGSFTDYWRETAGMPDDISATEIRVPLAVRILPGRDAALLDPPEIVDAALADPGFAAWVSATELRIGRDPILAYDPTSDVWRVGISDSETDVSQYALVDPRSGAVQDVVTKRP